MKLRAIILLAIAIAIIPQACAIEYYADIRIDVNEGGIAEFSGLTNHPDIMGIRDDLTSKGGAYWTFNLTIEDIFSDYIYELRLPPGASITYLNAPSRVRIGNEGGRITITGTGHDERLFLVAQYTIAREEYNYAAIAAVILIAAILLAAGVRMRKSAEKPKYNKHALTERQLAIVELLERSKKPITQKELEKQLKFPKSSLSRNIDSLCRKGIISKESKGMSNVVSLKKE